MLLDKCSFLDPRFKAEYLEDKEGTLEVLMSEAAAFDQSIATQVNMKIIQPQ